MNQFDAGATPMFDCFQDLANFTPYESVASNIPLDQLNSPTAAIADPIRRTFSEKSAMINFAEIDRAPEDLLNRILWNAMRGNQPYPEWAITTVRDNDDDEKKEVGKE